MRHDLNADFRRKVGQLEKRYFSSIIPSLNSSSKAVEWSATCYY